LSSIGAVAILAADTLSTRFTMLRSLFPKAYTDFQRLPLLGAVADGFEDWLAARGYSRGSRKKSIRF